MRLGKLIAALRPDGEELVPLVRAEMDPARYSSFEPVTAGPVVAAIGLTLVAILGALLAPIRLVQRAVRRG
ncbi:MAG TPA: hypothetical protein VFO29_09825 [Candidatus Rubrimentiphilum sp.]|nr:hypothetical protein [Candidatus Rubrimentiphilum sp.]